MLLALALLTSPALAESPSVLPRGSFVLYGGTGLSTFEYGSSQLIRDRVLFARLDTYASWGVHDRVQLALSVPVVHSWIVEIEDRGPCPRDSDYCDPILTLGDSSLEVRGQVLRGPVNVSLALAPHTNFWNRGTRHRFDAVGYAETGAVARAIAGGEGQAGPMRLGTTGFVAGDLVLQEELERGGDAVSAPLHAVSGGLEGWARWQGWTVQLGCYGLSKLGGVPFGERWVDDWYGTPDWWVVLRYQVVRPELKLSRALGDTAGVHLAVSRAVWTRGGPRDLTDISLGIHRWFPPRSSE